MKQAQIKDENRKTELEAELEIQKQRFLVASRRGMDALKRDLSVMNWMRAYPRQAAILIMVGGYVTAQLLRERRIRAYSVHRDAA
jgi:hypothetical protein